MAYTQEERMAQVTSPLGENVLLLTSLSAWESISSPFRLIMQFVSEQDDVDFAAVIGKPLAVNVALGNGNQRWFHGIVSRFSQGPPDGGFASYRAEVVPWLALLQRRADCRIFQHKAAPDIIKEVLTGIDVELQLSGDIPEREYCVQYRETDFHFVSRLMEEEGIGYFFKHSDKNHTMVLFNSPSAAAPVPGMSTVPYSSAVDLSPLTGSVSEFRIEKELASGKYSITDYNFEDPSMSLLTTTSSSVTLGDNEKYEIYDHPGEYLQLAEGERRVKLRMQAEECAAVRIHAQSDCASFTPGYKFELQGHFRGDCDGSYVITEVQHQLSQSAGTGAAGGESSYANNFSCIPHSVPFRPLQRTPKPVITGVQTATVVGASGKEIDVDGHGRVIVQFHWDRHGKKDENSSCRVRVSQNWAGKNWGMISNPRIGQEVIVEFIEGDPDRPIVTGRVYNGEQVVPYGLPGNATQTGIKTRSSMEGGTDNFNEIRFEDKKGEEQLFIHAEKNQDIEVENDKTESVGKNETITIGADRTETVSGNEKLEVKKVRTRTVGDDETVTIGKTRTHKVGTDETIEIGGQQGIRVEKQQSISIGDTQSVNVDKRQEIDVKEDQTLSVRGTQMVRVEKDQTFETGGATLMKITKELTLDVGDAITIKTGSASISLKKDGAIEIKGGKISIDGSDSVTVKGGKISLN